MRTGHASRISSLTLLGAASLVGASIAGGGGCGGFGTIPSASRLVVTIETPADQLPSSDAPRVISFSAADSYVIRVEAHKGDGTLDTSFNGFVRLSSKPGTVTGVTGDNTDGRNVQLVDGVADQVNVNLLAAFGGTRIWADDLGYVPADPARTPPPQCADGIDNNGNGTIDYPADPGCAFANDDTEDGSTYTAGASPAIFYQLPRVADVRGIQQGGNATSFPHEQVTIDTGYRGQNEWTYGTHDCVDSTCAGLVVTRVSSDGFYVTELADDDPVTGRGFGSVFAFNFSAPPNMKACDRLRTFGGTSSDFYGFTEVNYPTWELEEWDQTKRPCLIPEPHLLAPSCAVGGAAIPNCFSIGDKNAMLKVESALVRVATQAGVGIHIGGHFGPGDACCGLSKEKPCCCGGTDPAAPECADGTTLPTCSSAGQALTVTCVPTAEASNCDLNHDAKVDRTVTGSPEATCATACDADLECSEYANYLSQSSFKMSVSLLGPDGQPQQNGTLTVLADGSSDALFDPVLLKGQPIRSFTGTLRYFSGGSQFTIEARCADDIVTDLKAPPVPSDTACVHARTILDNSAGSN